MTKDKRVIGGVPGLAGVALNVLRDIEKVRDYFDAEEGSVERTTTKPGSAPREMMNTYKKEINAALEEKFGVGATMRFDDLMNYLFVGTVEKDIVRNIIAETNTKKDVDTLIKDVNHFSKLRKTYNLTPFQLFVRFKLTKYFNVTTDIWQRGNRASGQIGYGPKKMEALYQFTQEVPNSVRTTWNLVGQYDDDLYYDVSKEDRVKYTVAAAEYFFGESIIKVIFKNHRSDQDKEQIQGQEQTE